MSERMTDPIDIGSSRAEEDRAQREAEQRRKATPKQFKNPDGTWPHPDCEDCGEPIEAKRLEAIAPVTCFDCETAREKKGKQYGKR